MSADVLEFGPEVRPEQLQFSRYVGASGNDLVLTIEGGNGSVTISDWFDPVSPSVLGEFYFWSMGASLSDEQVFALIWANNTPRRWSSTGR
ncbi:MAG: hypothetical protein IPG34_10900 [Rhodocyclaceae bacterium]|nr:hypothetical protein [Rhodocyclaceae bacterium]